jgi:uncharacterized membrane protein YeaQ/YmgE (transglycosylase-associated protein family)
VSTYGFYEFVLVIHDKFGEHLNISAAALVGEARSVIDEAFRMWSFLAFLATGLIAGFLAEAVMKRPYGLIPSLVIGVIGAWIGGFLANLVDLPVLGTGIAHWVFEIAIATAGAMVPLFFIGLFRGRSSRA